MTFLPSIGQQKQKKNKKGITNINLIIILGFVILLAAFLIEYNGLVGKDYQLRYHQNLLSEKQVLAKKLEIKLTEIRSVGNLQEIAKNLNLVAIDKVKYLQAPETSMALSPHQTR